MDERTPLSGACSCGRNHYFIQVPSNLEDIQVLYDDRAEHSMFPSIGFAHCTYKRKALSLRVPLVQIHSTTYAFFEDEAPSTIRRVFTPPHAPHTKRHFCGLCGTSISHWSEENPEEAEWIYLNIGSLKRDSRERLEEAGLLQGLGSGDKEVEKTATGSSKQVANVGQGREVRGTPWFEEMIQGSELGRIKRRRGGETSSDGRTKIEWEISEFESNEGDAAAAGSGKRKLGSLDPGDDVEMRSG